MDSKEFRKRGTEMVEYICQYLETLEDRRVTPSVEPGYLRNLIPDEAPNTPEPWEKIMEDVESKIMPGVTHWQHPRFHAYFPAGNSFPSILGDMLGDAIGCIGFSWVIKITLNQIKIFYFNFHIRPQVLHAQVISIDKIIHTPPTSNTFTHDFLFSLLSSHKKKIHSQNSKLLFWTG